MTHLLPQTIRSQITGLIVVTLAMATVLVICLVQLQLLGSETPRLARSVAIVPIITIVQLAHAGAPEELDQLASAGARAGIEVRKAAPAELLAQPAEASRARLISRLNRFGNVPGSGVLQDAIALAGDDDSFLIRRDETNGLVFRLPAERGMFAVVTLRTGTALGIVAIFLTVLSVYAARWITSPLSAFASVARTFGQSPNDARVLGERGPREIVQLAQALNEMRTRIRALVESRTRMLAAIAHDLRTPLTRLRLYAELPHTDATRDNLIREITAIDTMLGETLAYLRDDAQAEGMSPVDLPSLLQTICSDFADLGHRASYYGPDRIAFACQPSAFRRAITNLVDNGIKHGSAVSVRLARLDASRITIEITDDGPGIPEALRDKVFEPFFKLDPARTRSGQAGFGLGLSIARDIIRKHRGEIRLHDRLPHGLRVRIMLPASTA
ncbi:HAMP domain-containing sensor histidine kinase [Phreatobacter stygius]|uniref:histidine kinase n=1 Tax=Phreatobacter stygius TaxID=1940610 RepID=A0A4D7BD46_9HYPH|nr:ATP-binding protein [Phreatobacter stygius]QCI65857.1 HAMP domain-containing protein [Phreatobacter stygius]